METIKLDGIAYRVKVQFGSLVLSFAVSEGQNSGVSLTNRLIRDILGTSYEYTMKVEPDVRYPDDFDAFFDAISAPVNSHMVEMPYGQGCLSYDIQKQAALAETGVKRVLLSTSDAAGLVVGSTVSIGDPGENTSLDRGQAYMRNIAHLVQITSIADVTIDGTVYAAVNLDLEETIDTTATTRISTMPWHSGSTEKLPGHRDGSIGSLTNGKYPARIAGVEVLNGAYVISIEPLYNVTANENGGFDYSIHVCRDSKNLSGSITANYVDTGIRLTGIPSGWQWVIAFLKNKLGILIPRLFGGNSSGWYKSAFYGAYSAGVRCPWRWGYLSNGGVGGLACENGYYPNIAARGARERLNVDKLTALAGYVVSYAARKKGGFNAL